MGVEFFLCVSAVLQSQLQSQLQSLSPQVRIPFPTRIARPSARMVRQYPLLLGLHLFLPPLFFRFLSLLDFNFDEFEALSPSGKLCSSDAAASPTASSPSSEACAKQ